MSGTKLPQLHDDSSRPRRPIVVAIGVGAICVLAGGAGLFAVLGRDRGPDDTEAAIPEVTFGPEDAATSIEAPAVGIIPVMQLSADTGTAGSEVRLQGAGFKSGSDYGRVELHWDRGNGPLLAVVDGDRFAINLTIPADAAVLPEGHNVVAVQRTKAGKVFTQTSVRYFVLPTRP